jgi:hypothetical protein
MSAMSDKAMSHARSRDYGRVADLPLLIEGGTALVRGRKGHRCGRTGAKRLQEGGRRKALKFDSCLDNAEVLPIVSRLPTIHLGRPTFR